MAVTPCVMLSRCQPDSAYAGDASAAAAARKAIDFRIIVPVPAGHRSARRSYVRTQPKFRDPAASGRSRSGERGRLIDAPDQAREPLREPAPLLLRQKAPDLTPATVRFDRQAARMQGRIRAAQCNAGPMPRKHDFN